MFVFTVGIFFFSGMEGEWDDGFGEKKKKA